MDTSPGTTEAGVATLRKTNSALPKLSVPPRPSTAAGLNGLEAPSPGPMTFVSSLFAEDPYPEQKSFSQLLTGVVVPSPTHQSKDRVDHPKTEGTLASAEVVNSDHTARFKSMVPSKLPIRRSPCLTIPPGMSPTSLLDSPVLFSTVQVQQSPTTGSYQVPLIRQGSGSAEAMIPEEESSPTFAFKPHLQMAVPSVAGMGPFGVSHHQVPAHSQAQTHETGPAVSSLPSSYGLNIPSHSQATVPSIEPVTEPFEKMSSSQSAVPLHPPPQLVERPSEDGYNWRKYGQKQVKGSEYPRSYYKCTYPSCHVKKKVERSYEGQITEIVYKGEHNHPKPQATRRMAMSNSRDILQSLNGERGDVYNGATDLSSSKGLLGTSEHSQGSMSDDEGGDGEASRAEDYEEDEGDFKRRKLYGATEPSGNVPLRTVREPRVVVQTTSDVDILDDGYRWRKYGQKVVKGNEHPRSYYKCTNVGCSVRKHVERSSKDAKAVITTYEGKHNHDVPMARTSHNDLSVTSTAQSLVLAHDTNTNVKPAAISLQEQLLGMNSSMGAELGRGDARHGGWVSERSTTSQGGPDQLGMNMMGPNPGGFNPFQGDMYLQQGFGLLPKEEPGDIHSSTSSLPSIYQGGQSSVFASPSG